MEGGPLVFSVLRREMVAAVVVGSHYQVAVVVVVAVAVVLVCLGWGGVR